MSNNLSDADRIVRGVGGGGLVLLAGLGAVNGAWQVAAMLVGSVGVFTATAAYCPLYRLLGLSRSETSIHG